VGLLALSLSAGCGRQIRPSQEIVKKDASLEELLTLYQLRREAADGFKGLMSVTADFPKQGRHTAQATVFSIDDQIRFRVFNLFGGTLFDLTMDGPVVSWTAEGKTFEGSRAELEEAPPAEIPLGSIELLDWVGKGGLPKIAPPDIPALEKGENFFILYLFTVDRGKGYLKEKIWIERTAFWVKKVETFDSSGARRGMITLDDYRKVKGREFPFVIEGQSQGQKVTLNFKEISLSPPATSSSSEETP
jgi:hypothetical protein